MSDASELVAYAALIVILVASAGVLGYRIGRGFPPIGEPISRTRFGKRRIVEAPPSTVHAEQYEPSGCGTDESTLRRWTMTRQWIRGGS